MSDFYNLPYCASLSPNQYEKYILYPTTQVVLAILIPNPVAINNCENISGGCAVCKDQRYASYDANTGVITLHQPGIYRLRAFSFIIDSNLQNPPRTSLINLSTNCIITDNPIVTEYPFSGQYSVSGEVLINFNYGFSNGCSCDKIVLKNISGAPINVTGSTIIDKIA